MRFLYFSKGSAGEVRNILNVLKAIDFIKDEEYSEMRIEILETSRQLSNYIKFVKKRNQGK